MKFLLRGPGAHSPARVGVLPGAFNPPTVAHLALAQAALAHVDEVVFVLPEIFPHKNYEGATLEARTQMLRASIAHEARFSAAVAKGGLFREIATELRERYGPETRISFLCGRDAAERILNWDYGSETFVAEMLREFDLLVARRRGELDAPLHARHAIERLDLSDDCDLISSTEVRERIARGTEWRHLVPEKIHEMAARIYSRDQK